MDGQKRGFSGWLRAPVRTHPSAKDDVSTDAGLSSADTAAARLRGNHPGHASGPTPSYAPVPDQAPARIEHVTHSTATPRTQDKQESKMSATPIDETAPTITVLSPKMVFRNAEMISDEEVVVHGQFLNGKLKASRLIVAPGAVVQGEIVADEIRCHGHIEGTIKAEQTILYKGSLVKGDLNCRILGMQPGSRMDAKVVADETQVVEHTAGRTQFSRTSSTGFEGDFAGGGLRLVSN